MNTEEILNILNNPEDKMYWVDDTHVLGFHTSPTSGGFEKSLVNGGLFPGSIGTTFGKGLYTNLCPIYTTGCFLGEFIQVFEIDIASDLAKDRTLITTPRVYKEVYNETPGEDFLLKQVEARFSKTNTNVPDEYKRVLLHIGRSCYRDLGSYTDSPETGFAFISLLGIENIQNLGYKNLQYYNFHDGNAPDGLSHVSYMPKRFCKFVGTFKLREGKMMDPGRLPTPGVNKFEPVDVNAIEVDSSLSSKIEKILLGTEGTVTSRFKKVFSKDERAEVVAKLNEIFKDDKFASKWIKKLK